MSKNTNVQAVKTNQDIKLENLLNSYIFLKSILSPNLNENNNLFVNSLIDLIISQLKIFLILLNLNEPFKLYEILNINNQKLSKKIAYLYELSKYSSNYSNQYSFEKKNNNNNDKDNIQFEKKGYSLEEPKQSFKKVSNDFELIENIKEKESKETEIKQNKNITNKKNKSERQKERKIYDKERGKEREKEKEKLIKRGREEREKFKEKKKIIKELKKKEKDREIREKAREILKKSKIKEKEKECNKLNLKKNSNLNFHREKKIFRNVDENKKLFLENYLCKTEREINTSQKKREEENIESINEKYNNNRNKTPQRGSNRFKYYLFDFGKEKSISEGKEEKVKRKNKRAKTVIYKSLKIPYLIGIENFPINNYISVSFTNRLLNKAKTPKKKIKKNNLIKIIVEGENINNKLNKAHSNNGRTKTESNAKTKIKNNNIYLNADYFSLEDFLVPYGNQKGEELFLTKSGNALINRKQKEILEDYINNIMLDDEEENKNRAERKRIYNNIIPIKERFKDKLKSFKGLNNKKYNVKGTNIYYDLKEITELLRLLPASFQNPIDELYLRKKKASLFDRSIFKICHKVIDNYKKLENKEDMFSFKPKNRLKGKPRTKSVKCFGDNHRYNLKYKKLYSN